MSVKKTMEMVCPKLYSWSPVPPMADIIEALGMVEMGTESSRARRTRSVCVVALEVDLSYSTVWVKGERRKLPKWISYN